MATLFFENFKNTLQWTGTTLVTQGDPLGQFKRVAGFTSGHYASTDAPHSSAFLNPSSQSFAMSFDYLGRRNGTATTATGGVVSVNDGGVLTDRTTAYAIAVVNSNPPLLTGISGTCLGYSQGYSGCSSYNTIDYDKSPSSLFLIDDRAWHHYSFVFTTTKTPTRVTIGDYLRADSSATVGDCFFANILVTDENGPSPFIPTSAPEEFRAISVDVLNQVANAVSYQNSDSAVTVSLQDGIGSKGYAEGDTYVGIVSVTGSNYNDFLYGDANNNTLNGGAGNDVIEAGSGSDSLSGGGDHDKFVITQQIGTATVLDFELHVDRLDLRSFSNIANMSAFQSVTQYSGGSARITVGTNKLVVLRSINPNDLSENDVCFQGSNAACGNNPPTAMAFTARVECQIGKNASLPLMMSSYVKDADEPTSKVGIMFDSLPALGSIYDTNTAADVALNTKYSSSGLTYKITSCSASASTFFQYHAVDSDNDVSSTTRADIYITLPVNVIYITTAGNYFGTPGDDKFVITTTNSTANIFITTGTGRDEIVLERSNVPLSITDFDTNNDMVYLTSLAGNCSDLKFI